MAQGGDTAAGRMVMAELLPELGMVGAAQGSQIHNSHAVLDHQLGVAHARRDGPHYESRCVLPDGLGTVFDTPGNFARQPRHGDGRGGEFAVDVLADGLGDVVENSGGVYGNTSGHFARQPRVGGGRGEDLVGLLPDGLGPLYDHYASFQRHTRPSAVRAGELLVGHGAVYDNSGNFAPMYDSSGNFAPKIRLGAGRGIKLLGALGHEFVPLYGNSGKFEEEARRGAGCGGELVVGVLQDDVLGVANNNSGNFAPMYDNSGNFAPKIRLGAGRGVKLLGTLGHDFVPLYGNSGKFEEEARPGAGCGGELVVGVLQDDVLDVANNNSSNFAPMYDNSGNFAPKIRLGAGRGVKLLGTLGHDHVPLYGNSGKFEEEARPGAGCGGELVVGVLQDDVLGMANNNSGTLAQRLQRLLPVAGMAATTAAVTGLADGTASPAAGFGLFALLLGGLSMVILHVLRA